MNMEAAFPAWVMTMVKAEFYKPCPEHPCRPYTFFCRDCEGKVLCETCTTLPDEHDGHRILRVFKASYRPVLRVKDINTLFDISDIHPYVINSSLVVFLLTKREKPHAFDANDASRCAMCGYELETSKSALSRRSYKFCSIACKAKSERNSTIDDSHENVRAISEILTSKSDQVLRSLSESGEGTTNESLRKRDRKGTPRRSPLF